MIRLLFLSISLCILSYVSAQDIAGIRMVNMRGDTIQLRNYHPNDKLIVIFSSGESCTACKESIGQFLNDSIQIDTTKARIVGVTNYAPSFQYMRSSKTMFRTFCPNIDQVFFDFKDSSSNEQIVMGTMFKMKHTPCILLIDQKDKHHQYLSYSDLFNYVHLSSKAKKHIVEFIQK